MINFFSDTKHRFFRLFDFQKRASLIEKTVDNNLFDQDFFKNAKNNEIKSIKNVFSGVKLNCFYERILKISNFVIKIFSKKFEKIDSLIEQNSRCKRSIRKLNQIILYKKTQNLDLSRVKRSVKGSAKADAAGQDQAFSYNIQMCRFLKLRKKLDKFKRSASKEDLKIEEINVLFKNLPVSLINYIKDFSVFYGIKNLEKDASVLIKKAVKDEKTVIDLLHDFLSSYIDSYSELGKLENQGGDEKRKSLIKSIESNDQFFAKLSKRMDLDDPHCIYDVSTDRLTDKVSEAVLKNPIHVAMVGVEFSGLMKVGGLAEALEGLSKGLKEQNPGNQVSLVFPKYSHLPEKIKNDLVDYKIYLNSKGEEYKVYHQEVDGIKCYFIEHPSFDLESQKPDIYGPDTISLQKRFTAFSELAADFLYECKNIDVIHLNDWHVCGVVHKLKNEHQKEWESGEIPPVLFTFHNNQRTAQGRIPLGPYTYDPVVKGYQEGGILKNNENLFVSTLRTVDAVTTVSESYGMESQQIDSGEGVSFAVRQAAKVGKLTGIINGINPRRWDPSTDPDLSTWKDIETGEAVDISYGPESNDILKKKENCKSQLQKWTTKFFPDAQMDFSKPLVAYIGRFDSYQKGLDKLEEAIRSTLENGGQFVCMGVQEDPKATKVLDKLQKKYKKGVLFIRDFKDPNGQLHYQQGERIGNLVRAAVDFTFIPSRFEPCGLVQFEGWSFGSLAIGSAVGGLADTIIPIEKDKENFNGFLFHRKDQKGAGKAIKRALQFWSQQNIEKKTALIQRLMKRGKQYGWGSNDSRSFSPVEKYRLAYENAKQRVKHRTEASHSFDRIEALKRCSILKKSEKISHEESYLYHYYNSNLNSESLEKLYQKVPESQRAEMPSPYGVGVNATKYEEFGSFYKESGTTFSVYAPSAQNVSVILVSEDEQDRVEHPMAKGDSGEWKAVITANPGQRYQYKINGKTRIDPYGKAHCRSKNPEESPYSVVVSDYQWDDRPWITERAKDAGKAKPMSIYEVFPTAWKKKNGKPLNYRELAKELVDHCKRMQYSHVELMGILEHADERSWGYQAFGYFSPNSRLGSLDDFKFMIEQLHKNNIGVILDWVPAHFADHDFSLKELDGSHLYESHGVSYFFSPRRWFFKFGSKHFDFKKRNTREFLLSSAHYWIKEMHIDGLRVDCIRSMLNTEDNKSSALFMRDLNAVVHQPSLGAFTMAEDTSGDIRVTAPSFKKGLDFDMKWHVGWRNYVFDYFGSSLKSRREKFDVLYKAIMCDNFHKQVMAFSHDDVRSSSKTLINKSPAIKNKKRYANARAMLSFMMCLPGKKMHCMGTEFGNEIPWDHYVGKEQGIMDDQIPEDGKKLGEMVAALNRIYRSEKAFYEKDDNGNDLEWIKDKKQRIHAYRRRGSDGTSFACFHNFAGKKTREFKVTIKKSEIENMSPLEVFNSDQIDFGGKERLNHEIKVEERGEELKYIIRIPPLSTIIIRESNG